MKLNQTLRILATLGLILLLATTCDRNGEEPDISPPSPGSIEDEESTGAMAPSEVEASPAEECLEMATREDWSAALDPCTRAARDHPEDAEIQDALERALAASEEPIE